MLSGILFALVAVLGFGIWGYLHLNLCGRCRRLTMKKTGHVRKRVHHNEEHQYRCVNCGYVLWHEDAD